MGKRHGITINIRDHDAEDWRERVAELGREIASLREQIMATMQDVQDRLAGVIRQAEQERTVVDGLQSVMDWAVGEIRNLRGLAGDPEAMAAQLDELANAMDGNRTRIAAAVATGTAAESEPAPQVDVNPQPQPGPAGAAAQAAGIRDHGNVRFAQATTAAQQAQQPAGQAHTAQAGQAGQMGHAPPQMDQAPQNAAAEQAQRQGQVHVAQTQDAVQAAQDGAEAGVTRYGRADQPNPGNPVPAAPQGQQQGTAQPPQPAPNQQGQQAGQQAPAPESNPPPQGRSNPPLDGFRDPGAQQGQDQGGQAQPQQQGQAPQGQNTGGHGNG